MNQPKDDAIIGSALGDTGPDPTTGEMSDLPGVEPRREDTKGGPTPLDTRPSRVDLSSGGGLNNAAVQAAGMTQAADEPGDTLGETRGDDRQNTRGQISGVGQTRGD